ncbi:hypothetical protein FS837_011406 [Tulasnella sp. UAMH 9824]|nr:hypothetical protein FS837_011406 [Tulasnella sp. UAMH 9824]
MDQPCDHPKRVLGEDPKVGVKLNSHEPPSSSISTTHGQTQDETVTSDPSIDLAPIQLLPHELLLIIFKLCVSEDYPVQDIIPLALVCKIWRNVVEGSPGLWSQISGKEELPSVQKALKMAKDAPLDITYWENVAKTDPATFFGEIGGRSAHWRSLNITTGDSDIPIVALQEAAVPNLRSLRFRVPWGRKWKGGAEFTLFGGEPAPLSLKDVCVETIPVIMEPLRLSGLRSLELSDMPVISAEEVLRILGASPALERCFLDGLDSLKDFGLSESDQELLRLKDVQASIIQLSRLEILSLSKFPMLFAHLFLSSIQAPILRWLSMDVQVDRDDQSVKSELFTPRISHLSPTLKTLTGTAEKLQIESYSCTVFLIYAGELKISLKGSGAQHSHMDETLEWIFSHIGQHRKSVPVDLKFTGTNVDLEWLNWFDSTLKITRLETGIDIPSEQVQRIRQREEQIGAGISNRLVVKTRASLLREWSEKYK